MTHKTLWRMCAKSWFFFSGYNCVVVVQEQAGGVQGCCGVVLGRGGLVLEFVGALDGGCRDVHDFYVCI